MVAAESGIAGMRPPTGFEPPKHPKAINQQGLSQTTGNGPIDWPRISAREKVQAALQQYQMFKPKREDNNRFVLSSGPRRSDPKVCDYSSATSCYKISKRMNNYSPKWR